LVYHQHNSSLDDKENLRVVNINESVQVPLP